MRKISGGVSIVEPLIYAEGQSGSYGEWDAIQIVPQEGISAAVYPWRQLFATIAISGLEEAQNNGEEMVINLLRAKVMQAEETQKSKLNKMLYADGTGNSGKDFLGPGGPHRCRWHQRRRDRRHRRAATCGGVPSSVPAPA